MENTSIFQGIVEFETNSGRKFRFDRQGGGVYRRYVQIGDVFMYDGTIRLSRGQKATPAALLAASDI